uniref:Uncharacterized protein n=1 Tax=Rhizophora mucronata TaxID=61149 RepID=A0A2P2R5B0_RHIMU
MRRKWRKNDYLISFGY